MPALIPPISRAGIVGHDTSPEVNGGPRITAVGVARCCCCHRRCQPHRAAYDADVPLSRVVHPSRCDRPQAGLQVKVSAARLGRHTAAARLPHAATCVTQLQRPDQCSDRIWRSGSSSVPIEADGSHKKRRIRYQGTNGSQVDPFRHHRENRHRRSDQADDRAYKRGLLSAHPLLTGSELTRYIVCYSWCTGRDRDGTKKGYVSDP